MTIVGGFDVHRQQITFDYVDNDGLVRWGQIRPATRKTLRNWLVEHCHDGDGEFALEGCTGWRYVVEELSAAGATAHLGDPAEIAASRGPKKRAKTDRADARLLRTLLLEGRFPDSWIPPTHVLEVRTQGRLYCALMEERRAWQQRIHAQLFHQGCPPIRALLSEAGRDGLASAELSAAGRQCVDTALRRIDELSTEIDPLRAQLVDFARRQPGCQALQASQYGVGWLCAAIIWAEIGDARRFRSSDQRCGSPGWTSPCIPPTANAPRGICPGRVHRSCGGRCSKRPNAPPAPARRTTPTTSRWRPGKERQEPHPGGGTQMLRRCYHTLRELGETALAMPAPERRPPEMRCVRALPTNQLMPAAGSRKTPAATRCPGGRPGKNERPHPFDSPHAGHPIHHHVAGPSSVDPDKFFGPLRGRPRMRENRVRSLAEVDPAWRGEPVDKFDPGSRWWGCALLL